MLRRIVLASFLFCASAVIGGCTREHHRLRADNEAYCIVEEKAGGTPWQAPPLFQIAPDPESRFYDPSPINDPELPDPEPRLYDYTLPALPERDPNRFRNSQQREAMKLPEFASLRRLPTEETTAKNLQIVRQVAFIQPIPEENGLINIDKTASDSSGDGSQIGVLRVVPIDKESWNSLPHRCLMRMLEFQSIREEYVQTFEMEPSQDLRDPSKRLTLEDIIDLGLINSREYQTQKEILYRVALQLSLDRYDYLAKFSRGGNGTAANYSHQRNAGVTQNNLSIPTAITADKVLATGGDLLARFANDVVLTFSGPEGFAADVGSELLVSISQSVFQRDIVFENLTQAERDVVYAARDFARFRKTFFQDLAAQYYRLLLAYRGIEIETQGYFSNIRAFHQGEAEYQADQLPRFQVDQFEQDALSSRSSLIQRCVALERSLDALKLQIGLPPEMALNINLIELDQITLRDEENVSLELVRRSQRTMSKLQNQIAPSHVGLVNTGIELTQRLIRLSEVREQLNQSSANQHIFKLILARLTITEARLEAKANRDFLTEEQNAQPPAPPLRIFHRTQELGQSELIYIERLLSLADLTSTDHNKKDAHRANLRELLNRDEQLTKQFLDVDSEKLLTLIPQLIQQSEALLKDTDALSNQVRAFADVEMLDAEQELQRTMKEIEELIRVSESMFNSSSDGLLPINVDVDEAMLGALIQRFDLMNQRGQLADVWRQIKLAGDDLKSILNLNAEQSIRTRSDVNRITDFTFDESETRLSMQLDTPFNRKAERNAFRRSLIDYQFALRQLIEAEDEIKLSIRNDLRDLQLDRDQYHIALASAALAYQRVVSTRLQLQLGIGEIVARDFLESQQAYTRSLLDVAGQHIQYLLDRINLFYDMELLYVDDNGFWPELYNEAYQATAGNTTDSTWPTYGELPCNVRYSWQIRRMLCVPELRPLPSVEQKAPEPMPLEVLMK